MGTVTECGLWDTKPRAYQVNIVKAKHTRKIAVSRKEVKFIESFLISGTVDEVNKYLELNDPDFLKLVESTKQLPKYDEQF